MATSNSILNSQPPPPPPSTRSIPSTRFQPRSSAPITSNRGSLTQVITDSNHPNHTSTTPLVLRLRGAHDPSSSNLDTDEDEEDTTTEQTRSTTRTKRRRRIQWATSVIDNEGLGRKKSKVCCIYHKPRAVGESSSDESSSDSSDSSSDDDDSGSDVNVDGARPVRSTLR